MKWECEEIEIEIVDTAKIPLTTKSIAGGKSEGIMPTKFARKTMMIPTTTMTIRSSSAHSRMKLPTTKWLKIMNLMNIMNLLIITNLMILMQS